MLLLEVLNGGLGLSNKGSKLMQGAETGGEDGVGCKYVFMWADREQGRGRGGKRAEVKGEERDYDLFCASNSNE